MKTLSHILIFSLISLLLAGCSSGRKAYETGNYYEAVMKSVERLRKNNSHKKSRETLKYAYPAAVDFLQGEIRNLQQSQQEFKWGRIADDYRKINRMDQEIRRSPGALAVVRNPTRYDREMAEANQRAAEEYYSAGLRRMNPNNRVGSKEAYQFFRRALSYQPNFKDANAKAAEAKEYATLKVVLEQIPVPGRYSLSARFFQENVEGFLRRQNRNDFVRFYTPNEARKSRIDADQILSLYFEDFVVGRLLKRENTQELRRDSVKVGTVTIDGEKVPTYGTVTADFTLHHAELISEGLLAVRITDARNSNIMLSERIPGSFTWVNEWATYNGDKRALTNEEIALTRRRTVPPPPPQDLFVEFTRPIYEQLTRQLTSFYRRY